MEVCLRKVKEEDLTLLMAWRNNPLVHNGFYFGKSAVTWEEHRRWWDTRDSNWLGFIICVTEKIGVRPVGFAYVKGINSACPETGIYIGEVTLWGKGVATEALRQLWKMLRVDYGKESIFCTVLEQNERSLKLHKRVGFIVVDKAREGELLLKLEPWVNIVNTGTTYADKNDPAPLFQAVSELIAEGEIDSGLISIDFYGFSESWLDEEIKEYGLVGIAKQHGKIPHEECLQKQREAKILWMMTWEGVVERIAWWEKIIGGLFFGKEKLEFERWREINIVGKPSAGSLHTRFYEYMAARKPILVTGKFGEDVVEVLEEIHMGVHAKTIEEIKYFIRTAF